MSDATVVDRPLSVSQRSEALEIVAVLVEGRLLSEVGCQDRQEVLIDFAERRPWIERLVHAWLSERHD